MGELKALIVALLKGDVHMDVVLSIYYKDTITVALIKAKLQ